MMTFPTPPSVAVTRRVDRKPLPAEFFSFHEFLRDVVMPLPYWRSNMVAALQAEEILDQLEREPDVYLLRDATHEALCLQMRLQDSVVLQLNPHLVRAVTRFLIGVENAARDGS
jgi:hypothetical protein